LVLAANSGVGDTAMTPEMLAIIAFVVSALSLFVSGGCLFVAYAAKQQAKNAAMLKQRNEAIALLRAALSALKEHRAVTRAAAQNITKAKDLADLFNPALRSVLGSVQRTAQRLGKPHPQPHSGARNLDDIRALESDLHKLIDEMTQETALVG
jgi:hypothetical protein